MAGAVARLLGELKDRGGLRGVDIANVASVSPATVSRWTQGRVVPHPRAELLISDLRYVVDRLSEFYTPEETRLWLYSRHRQLDDRRPIDLLHEGRADMVLGVIASLDDATYA